VADDPAAQALTDELFRNPLWEGFRGELGKGTREGRLAGKVGAAFPTADPAQGSVDCQPLDQRGSGRDGEHRLGDKGTGDLRPILR
jgi:hypothetical protein